jgi:hypothetical protein
MEDREVSRARLQAVYEQATSEVAAATRELMEATVQAKESQDGSD